MLLAFALILKCQHFKRALANSHPSIQSSSWPHSLFPFAPFIHKVAPSYFPHSFALLHLVLAAPFLPLRMNSFAVTGGGSTVKMQIDPTPPFPPFSKHFPFVLVAEVEPKEHTK
jgi:hypothetical protein